MNTYPGLPFKQYQQMTGMNFSSLIKLKKTPAHYKWAKDHPIDPSPAMLVGSIVHTGLLEPQHLINEYAVAPKVDRRTKVGKEEWENFCITNMERTVVDKATYDKASGMMQSVRNHPFANDLLAPSKGTSELTIAFDWPDPRNDMKARIDRLNGDDTIIDIKTTRDVKSFSKSLYNFGYHIQAAIYIEAANSAGNAIDHYYFICVESEAPYGVGVYKLCLAAIDEGFMQATDLLQRYNSLSMYDEWPATYNSSYSPVDLPAWAYEESQGKATVGKVSHAINSQG